MARLRTDDPYAGQGRFNQQTPFQDAALDPNARYNEDGTLNEAPQSRAQAQGGMSQPYRGAAGYDPNTIAGGYERRGGGKAGAIGAYTGSLGGGVAGGALLGGKLGMWGGPIGAAAGSIVGGLVGGLAGGRQAATAPSDFRVEDAREAIIKSYQQLFGRTPSQTEVDGHLQNVGWRPGHRYVGEQGLAAILNGLPSGAQNTDIAALSGTAPSGAQTTTPGAAQTAAQTAAGGQEGAKTLWGYDSPTGGKRELSYTPGQYEGEIGPYSGFNEDKLANGESSIKYAYLDFTRGLPPTVESLPELVRRLQEAGIPAEQVGYDLIDFGLGEGPVDIINQTRGGVWDWMPTLANGAQAGGGGESSFGAVPGQGAFGDLTGGFNYETLIQAILKDTLGSGRA